MPTPRRRPPSLGNATNVCPSIPITPRHARRARRLFRNHTSPDSPSPLLYIGELEPPPYVPYPVSVLDCCLPRSVLVAYIFPLARPLARHRNRLLFPPLCVCIFAASRLEPSVTPIHGTTNRAVEVTWAHHGLRHHGALSHPPRIHTHTSLPHTLASSSKDNNSRTPLPIHSCARFRLGNAADLIILPILP